ncbi:MULTISPECIES: c-type cytochrome [Marinobacter]|jgi:cytochrome c5|uniref:c-type cytochrome n=1 Tax=Marinobacter TaxID=2742 RepID=UPI000C5B1070|nr:cytochrome c5 family protein [Marinobacter nauticus]MAP32209.1 cytochrome c5 family protein [Marinobacter sp.]|tara:strand:- start:926 stop:1339 length:414 start_codon:yes stop_codon:yes gene_type:complete
MKRVLAVVLLGFGLAAGAAVASVEDEIRERIKPVGEVCLQGEECGEAAAPAETASSGPRSGSEVYDAVCMACHTTGAAGAPKIGDTAAWAPRIEKGIDTLIDHAINGFNAMPAKGGCSNCPDEEITAAVEHMVEQSK